MPVGAGRSGPEGRSPCAQMFHRPATTGSRIRFVPTLTSMDRRQSGGFAIARDARMWLVTDDEAVDDAMGETQFIDIGRGSELLTH